MLPVRISFIMRNVRTIFAAGVFFFICVVFCLTIRLSPSSSCDPNQMQKQNSYVHASDTVITSKRTAFLVILLMVSPREIEQRQAIRETWLTSYPDDVVVLFTVGMANLPNKQQQLLVAEHERHNDMLLLEDFVDDYYVLTQKLLTSLQWVHNHINFTFLFKADADTFARLDRLVAELRIAEPRRLYWGFFDGRARVKIGNNKWAESKWIICDRYTPHALGGGYVISADLVGFLATNAQFLQLFNSEDVSLGAWLGALQIRRIHDPRFNTEYRSRGCHNDYIVTHKQSVANMRTLHRNLKQYGRPCLHEVRERLSYLYNWKVPPSKCCIRNDNTIP